MSERTVFQSMAQRHVVSVQPNASIYSAACLMTREQCGSVLVIDTTGHLHGIVTERDMMTRVLAKAKNPQDPVSDIMTRNLTTVVPETKVSQAVVLMIERGFRHLPVVNASGKIMGVFSVRDALPREVNDAAQLAEFNSQVNDALG